MIDIVIPNVQNRSWTEQLRYVLRSFSKNFNEAFTVHIIGYLPDWCREVEHIPFTDDLQKHTEYNTHKKLKIAMQRLYRFIWTFDDIYLLQPIILQDITVPRVNEYLAIFPKEQKKNGPWFDLLWATYDRCLELNLPGFSFELHLPHYYESDKLSRVFELFRIEEGEHLAATAYYNLFFPGAEKLVWDQEKVVFYHADDFAGNPDFGNAKFLNHNNVGLTEDLKNKIMALFTEKSRFEK
jgi:hypothetical protein